MQDEISQKIAGAVGPTLALNEGRRAAQKRIEDLSAWDLYLRGRWHYYQNSVESRLRAIACFERSTELAPEFSDGHACIAPALIGNVVYGFSHARERDLKRATEEARLAIQLDSNNANAWRALAHALSMVGDTAAAL